MADASDDRRVGRIVGDRYRVTKRLAAGGMGVVYRAERLQLGRAVAIKFLHPGFAARPEALKRFEVEARAMGRLGHPHTVSVIDFGVDDGVPYVVMDFVHGKTLRELLDAGALPVDRSMKLFRQVLAGVAHAHGQGIIHRDLKPANIILTEATGTGDHVRILDFGLAKLADSGELSMSQVAVGTPSYMSPEQGRGAPVDARSDVYSLGVLLFELLTGEKPFFSDQAFDVIQLHANQAPPRLADKRPGGELSPELEAVVARALQKRPEDRFQTVAEFADALAATPEAAGRAPTATPATPRPAITAPVSGDAPTSESPIVPPRRRGTIWLGLGGLVLGGGLLAMGLWMLGRGGPPPPLPVVAVGSPDAATPVAVAPPAAAPEPPPAVVPALPVPDAAPPPPPPDTARPPDAPPPPPDAARPPDALPVDAPPLEIVPEEAAEPVAEVAPEPAVHDEEIDTAKRPEPPPPIEVNSVADVERLLRDGRKGEAIAGLERLREKQPKSAYVPYLLGNLYFERKWWSDGLESYRDAIRNNRAYRGRAVLVRNAIRALSSKKTYRNAQALLWRDIGAPAIPYLRTATKSDPNPTVRVRAAALVRQIQRRR